MRDVAYTERTIRRNTKHKKDRHRHRLCNIAREKAERKRSLRNEICHLVQYGNMDKAEGERSDGILVRPRHRTTSVTVCVLRSTYTVFGKAEEDKGKQKNGKTVRAGPRKRSNSQEGKPVTSISSGLLWAGGNSRRKRNAEREHKNATRISAGLKREGENGRNGTQETRDPRRGGKGVRLAVGPIVRELSSRFVWKQDSTREFVKTQTTERPQIPYQQKRKNIDTVTNPALSLIHI